MKYLFGIDGPNGAGKSRVIRLVTDMLRTDPSFRHHPVFTTRFPGGTALGEVIRSTLLDKTTNISPFAEFHLFFADIAETFSKLIDSDNSHNVIWLTDRTWLSTLCYQTARGVSAATVVLAVDRHTKTPYDFIFVLDLPRNMAIARMHERGGTMDRMESLPDDTQNVIADNWQMIASDYPDLPIVGIDATGSPEAVANAIFQKIKLEVFHE